MSVGDVAGLIAAIAFVALVGFLALPLVKLGKFFDASTESVQDLTAHTLPVIDETASVIATTNTQLERVDTITARTAEVTQNASALSTLVAATVGGPLVRVAAFTYGARSALASFFGKERESAPTGRRARGGARRSRNPHGQAGPGSPTGTGE